jgi:hypothetical protein
MHEYVPQRNNLRPRHLGMTVLEGLGHTAGGLLAVIEGRQAPVRRVVLADGVGLEKAPLGSGHVAVFFLANEWVIHSEASAGFRRRAVRSSPSLEA